MNSGPVGVVEVLEVRYNEGVAQMVCRTLKGFAWFSFGFIYRVHF